MQKEVLNHVWLKGQADLVKLGIEFPFNFVNGIMLTNKDKEDLIVKQNKDKVLNFISKKKRAYLSEICDKFNLDEVEAQLILNELKKEGKIKINK